MRREVYSGDRVLTFGGGEVSGEIEPGGRTILGFSAELLVIPGAQVRERMVGGAEVGVEIDAEVLNRFPPQAEHGGIGVDGGGVSRFENGVRRLIGDGAIRILGAAVREGTADESAIATSRVIRKIDGVLNVEEVVADDAVRITIAEIGTGLGRDLHL